VDEETRRIVARMVELRALHRGVAPSRRVTPVPESQAFLLPRYPQPRSNYWAHVLRRSLRETARAAECGKGVSQGLTSVRKAARENKEMKFTPPNAASLMSEEKKMWRAATSALTFMTFS